MTDDRLFLSTWEQRVEYKKVHDWGRDFNLNKFKETTAEEIVNDIN